MRRTFAWAGAGTLLVIAILFAAVLATRHGTTPHGSTASSVPSGPVITSPYDFTEAVAPVDFDKLGDAKFISLTLETPSGIQSYLLTHGSAGFASLIAALTDAQETAIPASFRRSEEDIGPSLTVVMEDRSTYTFGLDIEEDVLVRGTQAWRLQEDLKTLVEKAKVQQGR